MAWTAEEQRVVDGLLTNELGRRALCQDFGRVLLRWPLPPELLRDVATTLGAIAAIEEKIQNEAHVAMLEGPSSPSD
jgi:hypothetical protein